MIDIVCLSDETNARTVSHFVFGFAFTSLTQTVYGLASLGFV